MNQDMLSVVIVSLKKVSWGQEQELFCLITLIFAKIHWFTTCLIKDIGNISFCEVEGLSEQIREFRGNNRTTS